ncbi:hypothetical protein BDZ91DRAFT_525406 [Kalaharituber pfeilii]|nr:hypothetical protein BDZ91DRAFT_525406 [Kalaharituber pfeilii]
MSTPTGTPSATPSFNPNADTGSAQKSEGVSLESFLASLSVAAIVFGVEVVVFILIRKRMARIYEPRSYLVPEKRRTPAAGSGLLAWIKPIFATSSSDFIAKSGLDAYFFLRYLLMLLKIFGILAVVILPVLVPINFVGGKNDSNPEHPVQGLDRYAWSNVSDDNTDRYWAHLWLAIFTILLCCYMFYRELRGYIRLRQAYLTSPQHRLRASATTVLVTSIPRKWLSIEKLLGLYDVFPGGVRNIWINRDFEELATKVEERDKLARQLERAETDLIKLAKKKHMKNLRKLAKKNPDAEKAPANRDMSTEGGMSSGNPNQIPEKYQKEEHQQHQKKKSVFSPIPLVGDVVGDGINKIESGIKGVGKMVKSIVPGNHQTHGFVADLDDRHEPRPGSNGGYRPNRGSTLGDIEPSHKTDDEHENTVNQGSYERTQKKPWAGKSNTTGKDDERPLASTSTTTAAHPSQPSSSQNSPRTPFDRIAPVLHIFKDKVGPTEYPPAYDPEFENDNYGEPVWKKYLTEKDRPTHNLPVIPWLPGLPFIGQKVDTIHYCRKEIARLNVEIEQDQTEPEKYPLMNSAFIQFNNQVAAHMACQSLNHHIPEQMGPRYVEVNPNDIIWENMRIKWWERYVRKMLITSACAGLIIGWAFPVAFVGLVSQVSYLSTTVPFLHFVRDLPDWFLGLISGVLPPLGLAILMALLPIILRLFARVQGLHTGMSIELAVQGMYFAFLFVQVFLVVSISSGITATIKRLTDNPTIAAQLLAENLPKASNFFFSYLLLQAFAQSGGALLQIGGLVVYYLLAPIFDVTARQKWFRQVNLPEMKWGTFFPIYTNLACIGLVYSVISPLILIFNIITFGLFWIVYRYNLLFVTNFKFDTGGLLFPRAINQLFTGLYVMEICLVGLFFLVRDENDRVIAFPQGIIMAIVGFLTLLYQRALNKAFGPLFTYLPITLEDDAVERDRLFAQEHYERKRLTLVENEREGEDINASLERREDMEHAEDRRQRAIELEEIAEDREAKKNGKRPLSKRADKSRWSAADPTTRDRLLNFSKKMNPFAPLESKTQEQRDLEAQEVANMRRANRAEFALFDDIPDEIEDLDVDERDRLVARAFQHSAMRAKRPVIWIPRDDLGISDDEIYRTRKFSKHIWISNEYAGLDDKMRVVYRRSPPDFDARDLVEL